MGLNVIKILSPTKEVREHSLTRVTCLKEGNLKYLLHVLYLTHMMDDVFL